MNLDPLHLGIRVDHTTAAITGNSTAQAKASTDAATYTATGTPGVVIAMNATATPCPRYAVIGNLDPSIVIHVNVGNSQQVPPAATTCSTPVMPGAPPTFFEIPGGGLKGVGGAVSVKATSGAPLYSLAWIL